MNINDIVAPWVTSTVITFVLAALVVIIGIRLYLKAVPGWIKQLKPKTEWIKKILNLITLLVKWALMAAIAIIAIAFMHFFMSGVQVACLLFVACAAFAAFVWFAYEASKKNTQATTVALDEFKFIVAGESPVKILHNLKDAWLDKNDEVTTEKSEEKAQYNNPLLNLLKDWLGIYWVSFLYPLREVFSFKIDKKRLVDESTLKPGHTMADLVKVEVGQEVKSLRRFFPRPFYASSVELKDGFPTNILVMTEFEVIRPKIPVMTYKGNFFPLLDTAVESAINDIGNTSTFMDLITTSTKKGSRFSHSVIDELSKALLDTVGIRINEFYIVQLDLPEDQDRLRRATVAEEEERLLGEGRIVAAKADAVAIKTRSDAYVAAQDDAIKKLVALNVDPSLAAQFVAGMMNHREVAGPGSKISTYYSGVHPVAAVTPQPQPTQN